VNVQDYISSGIIESYVMGIASPDETAEFEKLCELHPEIKNARLEFELALETKAFANARKPPTFIKEKIFEKIQNELLAKGMVESYVLGIATEQEKLEFEELCRRYPELKKAKHDFELALEARALAAAIDPPSYVKEQLIKEMQRMPQAKVIAIGRAPVRIRNTRRTNWIIAASVIVLLGCAGLIFSLYSRNRELRTEMAEVNSKKDSLNERAKVIEEKMIENNPAIKLVNVITSPGNKASINVFWDSASTSVYLVVKNLPVLTPGEKYHLWSIANGQHKSLGLFDAPTNDRLILKMNNAQHADSFSISIDKKP
jgi:hypothetical protein